MIFLTQWISTRPKMGAKNSKEWRAAGEMALLTLTSEGPARRIEFAYVLDRVRSTSRRQLCWVDRRFSFLFHSGPPLVKVAPCGARVSARRRRL